MLEARIYIGLRDRDVREQLFDTDKYKSILKNVCRNYQAPFTLQVIEGGYFHDDGTFVNENTLLLTLIGVSRKIVYEIAKDVCAFFRQESVMITGTQVVRFNVHDVLDKEKE